MVEVDNRGTLWQRGHERNDDDLCLELYRLLCVFSASEDLARRRGSDTHELTVYGYVTRAYERREISRILVSVSAILRNAWDSDPKNFSAIDQHQDPVGTLVKDVSVAEAQVPLRTRESFNKIIHADTMNLDRTAPLDFDGSLLPYVHFYGSYQGKSWRASIDVYAWCEAIRSMLRL